MVRGREDMCIRRGDQLLKQNGGWAFSEVSMESPEGFEDLPGMEDGGAEGIGETMLVMDFGRFVQRPCPPQPPRMEPWEVGYGLRVEIDPFLAGPYEEEVIAWALILKEEVPDANLGSESLGKAESCWRAYNSESGKVRHLCFVRLSEASCEASQDISSFADGLLESDEEDEEKSLQAPPPREVVVSGADPRSLGRALAEVYGERTHRGLQHAKDYYTELPPISCSTQQWKDLAALAQKGARLCCPTAAAFFDGLKEGLGWEVYETMLDFEVYTLELQRRSRVEARQRSSSSSSSSDSSSESFVEVNLGGGESKDSSDQDEVADEPSEKRKKLLKNGRCTGFAIAGDTSSIGGTGKVAIASQTVDLPGILYGFGDFDCVLRLQLPSVELLVYDSDGRLCPIGLNSAGLGICVFNLHDRQTDGFQQASLSVQTLVWELLLSGHTMTSALSWLRDLCLQPMCGSALLLVDDSGAVTVELNPGEPAGGPVIGEVRQGEAVSRANHPILAESNATFGGNRRARVDSQRRLEAVQRVLEQRAGEVASEVDANGALSLLRKAKKVRNLATLAIVSLSPTQGHLLVEFRERQEVSAAEAARFAVEMGLAPVSQIHMPKIIERALSQGGLQMETKRPRMSSGETAFHVTRWAKHAFQLSAKPSPQDSKDGADLCAKKTGDLRKIYMSFI
eukprot:symbB.v1.2.027286.t1/scaffold2791.1/size70196/3